MVEDEFVETALKAAMEVLAPPLTIERGACLLYEITVDNRLALAVNTRDPRRGQSAFHTDLCVFDAVAEEVRIPRVVLEFKERLTTHDVLTYSAKARKHKQVYPYLRYGLVISRLSTVPGLYFKHNEALDFAVAVASYGTTRLHHLFEQLLTAEVAASRQLEAIAFDKTPVALARTQIVVEENAGPHVG
jgi:hypothetical protein